MKSSTKKSLAVALVAAAVGPAGVAEAAMNVRIVNTQGQGVAARNAPQQSARTGYGAPEGATVTLQCHAWGEAMGSRQNRLWDWVTYQGRGFYVWDGFTDAPTTANRPVNGIPMCGQAAPSAPVIDDNVARWAQARVGQAFASGADHQLLARYGSDGGWAPGPYGEWSGDCMRFAAAAWYSTGRAPLRGATAKAVADAYRSAGRLRAGSPPRGALVFYHWGNYGHVGISLGNDQIISTSGTDGNRHAVRQHHLNGIGLSYRGWADPR